MGAWSDNWWWASNVAEWVGGLGTIGALVFAGVQVRNDVEAGRTQRDQNATILTQNRAIVEQNDTLVEQNRTMIEQTERSLQMQAARDELDRQERRGAQAALVSCATRWHPDEQISSIIYNVRNDSPAPIFEARLFWMTTSGGWSWTLHQAATLISGQQFEQIVSASANRIPPGQFCGVTFRDNAGVRWIKWGDGRLLARDHDDFSRISPTDSVMIPGNDPRDQPVPPTPIF